MHSRHTEQTMVPPEPALAAPRSSVATAFSNILVNNPAGETFGSGNTQMEPSLAAHGDTIVCGFTDSRGLWGSGTLTGYAWSVDGGQTWTDGGSLANPAPPMLVFGDPTVATDFQGRWYCLSALDRGNGPSGPGSGGLNVALHRGRFLGAALLWEPPVIVAGNATEVLDSAHLAVDPDRDRVYVAFTNVTLATTPSGQIEVVTLNQRGGNVLSRVVVQPHTPGVRHNGSRVAVGPNGEVYCAFQGGVWSGGDGQGPGTQRIARSLDFGATYSAPVTAATVIESWLNGPPGANREEESVEFPSLAVDRSSGPNRGRVYLAWHDAVLRDFSGSLTAIAETASPNGSPQEAQVLPPLAPPNAGWNINGALWSTDPSDWYRFAGQAGDHMRMVVSPGSGTMTLRLVLRCAGAGGNADTTLAASWRSAGDQVFFLFTLPNDGDYYIGLFRIGSPSGTYQAYLRRAVGVLPSAGTDHRDIVVVSSPDGVSNWTPKVRVHDDLGFTDQALPEVTVDGDGGVHVAWYDRRWDPHCRALADVAMSSSFDGGLSFTPAVRVTSGSSWWQVSADAVPNFGDQFRPIAAGDRLHMAWADGRRGDPDIMYAPLETGFTLALPESVQAVAGVPLPLAGTLKNNTPHDGAVFMIRVASSTAGLPDSTWMVGPVPAGGTTPCVYAPVVGDGVHGSVPIEFEVACSRSAQVQTESVIAHNFAVPVWLKDFSARADGSGVTLTWRGSSGARFHVQRASEFHGPFAALTPSPLLADASGQCTYHDATAPSGTQFYRLQAEDLAGEARYFGPYRVDSSPPARFELVGAVPNPFNPSTEIRFTLPRDAAVTLRIVDARGRRIAVLLNAEPREPGTHAVGWDGRDTHGVPQASGVYWAELVASGHRATTRLVLIR